MSSADKRSVSDLFRVEAQRIAKGPERRGLYAVMPTRAVALPISAAVMPVRAAVMPVRAAVMPVRAAVMPVRAVAMPVSAAMIATRSVPGVPANVTPAAEVCS
jgi:hypothetical protein